MKYLIQITMLLALSSCTISISQVHSQGSVDTLQEDQKADADVSPTFSLPAFGKKPGAKDTGLALFSCVC